MTKEEFYEELKLVDASRQSRLQCAALVKSHSDLFPFIVEKVFEVNHKDSIKAAWVLEFVCADYIYVITPYLDLFSKNIHKVRLDSAMRPVAKVCNFIVQACYSKENNTLKRMLTPLHKERLIETNFDWMLSKNKVAVKVFAMDSLYYLGMDQAWVHTELKQILEKAFLEQSAAFKSRAKRILKKMEKQQKT